MSTLSPPSSSSLPSSSSSRSSVPLSFPLSIASSIPSPSLSLLPSSLSSSLTPSLLPASSSQAITPFSSSAAAIQCLSTMTKSRSSSSPSSSSTTTVSSLPTTPLLSSSSTTATNCNNLAPLHTKRPATLPTTDTKSTNSEEQQTNINADRNSDASDARNPKRSRPTRTLVAYMKNKQLLATGYVTPDRTQIHGHRIPENYICVELTFAATNVQAPCVLGDKEENSVLLSGSYFALPCKDLLVPRNVNNGNLMLQPFCSSR